MRKSFIISLFLIFTGLSLFSQSESNLRYFISSVDLGISAIKSSEKFVQAKQGTYLGFTDKYVYVEVIIPKGENIDYLIINNALLDSISWYKVLDNEVIDSFLTGQAIEYNRKFDYQDYIIKVNHNDQTLDKIYFKIRSSKPINLPIAYNKESQLIKNINNNDLIYGAFIGIILVMLFYNLMVYFVVRDSSYIYYVFYLMTVAIAQSALFGYTDRLLFRDMPWLNNNMTFISGGLVGIFSLLFIKNFLHLRTKAYRISYWFDLLIVIDIIAIVMSLMGYRIISYNIINFVASVGALLALFIAVKLWDKGYKPAKFFVIAWSIFLLSVFIFVMKDYNIIPFNSITRRSILIGSVVEVVLLSIALADKINVFRKEKEDSQAEALKVSKENERIIREQNIMLERKVQERTMEIQEANEELQSTLNNLKETQTQLVDAEKMASLGQLTAGIAHEINNPINFVTSNITPLRRDLQDIYEILENYASVSTDEAMDGLKKAHELQKELDYEYLKEEIDSLVQGISDGARRTQEIVKGLRTFSRLDEDVIKKADINEGLDSTLIILQNKIKNNIELIKDYDDELMPVECFPGKLNQVFMNILNNGIYAVEKKVYTEGETPLIKIETTQEENVVKIKLSDNGIGMNENTRKKIFEPFYTTKDVGEGTGLGMSIVFKIIEKHQGKIEVLSEEGKGTEFIITLPLRQPKEDKA